MTDRVALKLILIGALVFLAILSGRAGSRGMAAQTGSAAPTAMAADADRTFEVATIKPSGTDGKTKYFRVSGRTYVTHNTALADLIEVAYGVHPKQIVGAPAWVFDDKYDLVATPDGIGQPSGRQWLGMMRKLIAERFKVKLHHEQQALSVYVLSIGKEGPIHLAASQSASQFPSLEFHPVAGGLMLPAKNTTLGSFCQMMQQVVLDRPVADRTGLAGKFDFDLTFMPDDSQFNGHPPAVGASNSAPEFEALQQQLGLRLTAEKVVTDVLVLDHAEKPSAN